MHILMLCRVRTQALCACREIFEQHGITCTWRAYESAQKLRRTLQNASFDLLLTAESAVLPRRQALPVPTVYVGTEYYCADAHIPSACSAYWIAHEELAFDFLTHGAREKNVRVCGVPLTSAYRRTQTRSGACRALGLDDAKPIFSFWTDGVPRGEIQASVRACRTLCPQTRLLLWSTDAARRGMWQTLFAGADTVFVPDADDAPALAMAAGDVLFTPAFAVPVSAAARQDKNIVLLHAAAAKARQNAAFLDTRGIAFCGKTAADNVSYACRLLAGTRLQENMRRAQEKYILRDAEQRVMPLLREAVGG